MPDPKAPNGPLSGSLRDRMRETASLFANTVRTLKLIHSVAPRLLVVLVVLHAVDALSGIGIAYVGKKIVDAILLSVRSHAPDRWVLPVVWVSVEFALVGLRSATSNLATYYHVVLRSTLGLRTNLVILEKASNVSYGYFEDPEFMNKLTQARREATTRPMDLMYQVFTLVRATVGLAGFSALLWSLGPWAVAILVVTAIPPFLAETKHGRIAFAMQRRRTQRTRKAYYLESILADPQSVKEIKLFSLARWLIDRYREVHMDFHNEEIPLARTRSRDVVFYGLLGTVALYATYAFIAVKTAAGMVSLGSMTLYVTIFRQGQANVQAALAAIAKSYEDNLFMTNLFEYLDIPDDEPDLPIDPNVPSSERAPRVEFRNVSFRYPGAEKDALSDINLTFHAGETVALVGRNGAGKTTLVKLLVGLYRPTTGSILIDGEDTAKLPAAVLRQKIGVIFQDFVRFQFSAGDNVGVGWLPAREDAHAIGRAVSDAGATEVIDRLPNRLDTPLGRAFGGDDLSVGQWQRIALARAFMRKSKILVLDEPTAAMDAEAEHEIFQRFRDLKANRTALLITHRFSTVRMADRVVVFENGRVVEEGPHAHLIAANGRYATMFRLQAEGYELDPPAELPAPAVNE